MKITNLKKLKPKKLIVFDLDGTLIPTKSPMEPDMVALMAELLAQKKVAIIGGGKYGVFKTLFLQRLHYPMELYHNLFLFPTTSTAFYRYNKGWKKIYEHQLTKEQRTRIIATFHRVFKEIGYKQPKKIYGTLIEDRGTQVTYSVFGQDIVKALGMRGVKMKLDWKKKHTPTKIKIAKLVAKYLPDLEVRAAGYTSIDVTKKGIDKAYGLHQIEKYLKVKVKDMLFVGDAIEPGGNDYAVVKTGVDYVPVDGPADSKKVIEAILAK